jgi:hypothetical protein
MEDKTKDYEAELELQKLEERLGMKNPAAAAAEVTTDQTVSVGGTTAPADPAQAAALQSEADKQLDELEKRIKGS